MFRTFSINSRKFSFVTVPRNPIAASTSGIDKKFSDLTPSLIRKRRKIVPRRTIFSSFNSCSCILIATVEPMISAHPNENPLTVMHKNTNLISVGHFNIFTKCNLYPILCADRKHLNFYAPML